MKPVLGLVPDPGLRAVDDRRAHLLAAMGGEAMKENRVAVGAFHRGVIDDEAISKIVNLPEEETVAALIVYGYPDGESKAPPRKEIAEMSRFI